MKTLTYSVTIDAPVSKVWETMLQPETFNQWVAASWPGSHYEGSWREGETIKFLSKDGSGTKALIETNRLHEYIMARHIAVLDKGKEDTTSELAKGWIGITESYTFKETNGQTELTVEIKTTPEWEKMFNDGWPGALEELKKMCEGVAV